MHPWLLLLDLAPGGAIEQLYSWGKLKTSGDNLMYPVQDQNMSGERRRWAAAAHGRLVGHGLTWHAAAAAAAATAYSDLALATVRLARAVRQLRACALWDCGRLVNNHVVGVCSANSCTVCCTAGGATPDGGACCWRCSTQGPRQQRRARLWPERQEVISQRAEVRGPGGGIHAPGKHGMQVRACTCVRVSWHAGLPTSVKLHNTPSEQTQHASCRCLMVVRVCTARRWHAAQASRSSSWTPRQSRWGLALTRCAHYTRAGCQLCEAW